MGVVQVVCIVVLWSCPMVYASVLSTFTSDTIKIHFPTLPVNASISEEIVCILSKHWLFHTNDWIAIKQGLSKCSSVHERSEYLGSFGDPYCRIIKPEDMMRRTFKGTRVGSGIAVSRNYGSIVKNIFKLFRTRSTKTGIMSAFPQLALIEQARLGLQLTAPVVLLAVSSTSKHILLPRRRLLFKAMYSTILIGSFAYHLSRFCCPVEVREASLQLSSLVSQPPGPGDELLTVDGCSVRVLPLWRIQSLLNNGKKDEHVKLKVRRKESSMADEIVSPLIDLPLPNVKGITHLGSGVGSFSVSEFNEKTFEEVQRGIATLHSSLQSQGSSLKALVMDLRGNGGGLISAAFDVASIFLPKGAVLSRIAQGEDKVATLVRSDNRHPDLTTALLLLVDGATASASEILAAALVDNGRASLAGQRTVGKNMAQAIVKLSDGSGLVFTVRTFTSPSQRAMGSGLEPELKTPKRFDLRRLCWKPEIKSWSIR